MFKANDIANGKWNFITRVQQRSLISTAKHLDTTKIEISKELDRAQTKKDRFSLSEKIKSIDNWRDGIEVGISELEIMKALSQIFMVLSFERTKVRMHFKYIFKENTWLREEMFFLHKLLVKLENYFLIAEAEKRRFQYYYNMRNYGKIEKKKTKFVPTQIKEEDEDTDPEEIVPVDLKTLYNLVMQFVSDNHHTVAMAWCEKSLDEYRIKYGEESVQTAALYSLLGRVYKDYGIFATAQEYMEKAVLIREKVVGPESDELGISLSILASLYNKRKDMNSAIQACKKALYIREKIHGRKHIEIAQLYAKLGEYSYKNKAYGECIKYYSVALKVFEQVFDQTDNFLLNGYTTVASALIHSNKPELAKEHLEKVNLSYLKKNNPKASKFVTPFSFINESLVKKSDDVRSETLMNRFGKVYEVCDERLIEVMIHYYNKINEPKISELLKGWLDLSNRSMNRSDIGALNTASDTSKSSSKRDTSVKPNKKSKK